MAVFSILSPKYCLVFVHRAGPHKATIQATRSTKQGDTLIDLEGLVVGLQAGDKTFFNVNGYVLHIV